MQKMDGKTYNNISNNIEVLKQFFPEVVSEDKIDFEKLQLLLGKDIVSNKEKFTFSWKGKSDSIKIALAQNTGTLRPNKESSKNWDTTGNLYIEGDNLEVLRTLQDSYRGKVKMIYIDPPYNTGKDFVYKDNFHDNVDNYKDKMDENMKSNPETNGRYHTDWLNMMYPRLKLARNLMTDDGVIFISIDDNEIGNLKKICDEIFGEDNFLADIIWQRSYSPVNMNKYFSPNHDYCLVYGKNISSIKDFGLPRTDEANARYSNPDNDSRGDWKSGDIYVGPVIESKVYEIVTPSGRKVLPPSGRCWRYSKEKYNELVKDNRISFGKKGDNIPSIKRFLTEVQNKTIPLSIWEYKEVGHSQDAKKELMNLFDDKSFFDYPKSVPLIIKMIKLNTSKNDIVLDFFSGSSTTAHSVMKVNSEDELDRKFIMVQIPELTDKKADSYKEGYKNICEIGKERIRRAGDKIVEDNKDKENINNLDIGFKVFKLDTTNLKKWETTIDTENSGSIKQELQTRLVDMTNPVKEDRKQIDMVYEIMLKNGMDLSLPMKEIEIQGKKVFTIASNYLIICLEKDLSLEIIKEICDLKSKVAVFYDESFKDDVVKLNAIEQLEKQDIQVRVI